MSPAIPVHCAVAVKVLRSSVTDGRLAAARFEREARAVAALNHPHICAIYDVGEDQGHHFLVMELLMGEALEQRLAAGPFELPALLEHGAALADALATAHGQGLIHRDLKPGNIFITTGGQVKLLDFGLAKAVDPANATTLTADATDAGIVPGTVAYMSPEQLRGLSLDQRTDLFSLGLVLYEMATGRRAFTGSTGHLVAAAILDKEPPRLREVRPDLPVEFEHTVLKAVEKDRELRYQSAAELRADLKRLQRETATRAPGQPADAKPSGTLSSLPSRAVEQPTASSDTAVVVAVVRRHWRLAMALLVGLSALAVGAMVLSQRRVPPQAPAQPFINLQVVPLTFSGDVRFPAISPDGRFAAFVRQGGLWVRQLSGDSAQKDILIVPRDTRGTLRQPTFTPDGNAIDFGAGDDHRDLWRVPLLGGTASLILKDVESAVGWAPDGQRFAFVRNKGLANDSSIVVADRNGANERVLATRHSPRMFCSARLPGSPVSRPAWSPDGRTIAVAAWRIGEVGGEMVLLDAETGVERRTISTNLAEADWLDAQHVLAGVSTPPAQQGLSSLDIATGQWTQVTHDLAMLQNFSLTADRATALATRTERRLGLWLGDEAGGDLRMLFDLDAAPREIAAVDDSGAVWYVTYDTTTSGSGTLYRTAPGTTEPSPIAKNVLDYAISADGGMIVLETDQNTLVRMNADGSGRATLVDRDAVGPSLTPDGRTVFFVRRGKAGGLMTVSVQGGTPRQVSEQLLLTQAKVSPAGDRLAFIVDGSEVVRVCDLPDCRNQRTLEIPTGGLTREFEWAPGGAGLAYSLNTDRQNLWVRPLDGGSPMPLTRFAKTDHPIQAFDWSVNGKYLVLQRGRFFDDLVLITGLR